MKHRAVSLPKARCIFIAARKFIDRVMLQTKGFRQMTLYCIWLGAPRTTRFLCLPFHLLFPGSNNDSIIFLFFEVANVFSFMAIITLHNFVFFVEFSKFYIFPWLTNYAIYLQKLRLDAVFLCCSWHKNVLWLSNTAKPFSIIIYRKNLKYLFLILCIRFLYVSMLIKTFSLVSSYMLSNFGATYYAFC